MFQQPDSLQKHHDQQLTITPVDETDATDIQTEEQPLAIKKQPTKHSSFTSQKKQWQAKVDSVLMPDLAKEMKVEARQLPTYYKNSYFAKDSTMWHTEMRAGRYGIAGDPVPYTVRNDSILTSILIVAVLLLILCISRSAKFLKFQISTFFRVVRSGSILERESASENRYLVYSTVYTALILSLAFFFYAKTYIGEAYITFSEYTLMAIFFGCFLGFFLIEYMLYSLVNSVFFTPKQKEQWYLTKMLSTTFSAVLLTPMLLLLAYFGLSVENALIYTLIVIVLVKILLFYKCFLIFFRKLGAFLQFFLYFCTLEIIPPLILWGILLFTANYLKVNY